MSWLNELEEGDEVIVVDGLDSDYRKSIEKVLRTTKTRVILESGEHYSKRDGARIPYTEFYKYEIQEATPEAVWRVNEAKRNHELFWRVANFFNARKSIEGLSSSQLERIAEIIGEGNENN